MYLRIVHWSLKQLSEVLVVWQVVVPSLLPCSYRLQQRSKVKVVNMKMYTSCTVYIHVQYLSMVDENVEERVEQEYSVSCDTGRVQQDRLERE